MKLRYFHLILSAGLALTAPALAQDEPPEPVTDPVAYPLAGASDAPLEVTIRPSYRELKEGLVEDAIIRLNDRQYMLYSGWYVEDVGPRLRLPGEASSSSGLSGLADAFTEAMGNAALDHPGRYDRGYRQLRRYGLNRDNLSLELGTRFQGMNYVEIALSFDVDPFPRPVGFAGRGIYGRSAFNAGYSLANQTLGNINLITPEGPDAEFYYQVAPEISAVMAEVSE